MDLYLKRYFWLVGVIVVAACASFAAAAVNDVVEAKYLTDSGERKPRRPARPATAAAAAAATDGASTATAAAGPTSKAGAPLADRNMFCSTCVVVAAVEAPAAGPSDPNNPPATTLPLRLIATNVSTVAESSFATIQNTSTNKQGAYWIGHEIPGAGKVTAIRGKFVDFENSSARRVERIALGGAEPPPVAAAAPPAEDDKPAENKDDLLAAIDAGIKKVDDSNYEIDRALVDKVLANPMGVAKGARVVPSIKNGKPNGFKLYAIRPSSVYAKIGLMNGDTINSVNGFDLTTPDKALEVYTKVRESTNLSVTVTRRGKTVTLNYNIK